MVVLDFDGHPQKYDQLEVAISLNTSAKCFVLQCMLVSRFSLSPLVISNGIPAAEWEKREVRRDEGSERLPTCLLIKNVRICGYPR